MKKIIILLIVVIMLAGLAFSSFAEWTGNGKFDVGDRDCLKDGTGIDCPNPGCPDPEGCEPIGDEPNKQKSGK